MASEMLTATVQNRPLKASVPTEIKNVTSLVKKSIKVYNVYRKQTDKPLVCYLQKIVYLFIYVYVGIYVDVDFDINVDIFVTLMLMLVCLPSPVRDTIVSVVPKTVSSRLYSSPTPPRKDCTIRVGSLTTPTDLHEEAKETRLIV